jgi:hypothetical protein
MQMKKTQLFAIGILIAINVYSQNAIPTHIRAINLMQQVKAGVTTSDVFFEIPLPAGKVVGDTYLDTKWKSGSIMLFDSDKMVKGYPIRYDINTNEIEISSSTGVKVLFGKKVRSFMWLDSLTDAPHYFVNASAYAEDNAATLSGFFEVLVDGNFPLFKRTSLVVEKANYNPQLNAGSRDDKIIKQVDYFAASGNKVIPLPSSKKKFFALFGDRAGEIMNYSKQKAPRISREEDLKAIFSFHNNPQ